MPPQCAKRTFGILGGHRQHVRVEVAERGGEDQRRAVLRDHAASMVFCTAAVSGTFSSSTTLTPGIFLSAAAACGLRLVVAVVVARADVDHAHGQRRLRAARCECAGQRQRGAGEGAAGQQAAARRSDGLGSWSGSLCEVGGTWQDATLITAAAEAGSRARRRRASPPAMRTRSGSAGRAWRRLAPELGHRGGEVAAEGGDHGALQRARQARRRARRAEAADRVVAVQVLVDAVAHGVRRCPRTARRARRRRC